MRDRVRMGDLGASGSFLWGGLFGGSGTFDRVCCAIFCCWPTSRGICAFSTVGTLGATCCGVNFTCSGTTCLLVVGGLSVFVLGFMVSLGVTLGDGTGGAADSGLIHFAIAHFNDAKA